MDPYQQNQMELLEMKKSVFEMFMTLTPEETRLPG